MDYQQYLREFIKLSITDSILKKKSFAKSYKQLLIKVYSNKKGETRYKTVWKP